MKVDSSIVSPTTGWRLHLRFLGTPWLVLAAGLMAFLFFAFVICRMAEFPFWMASWWFAGLVAVVAGMTAMFLSPGSDAELSDFGGAGTRSRNRRDFERARQQSLQAGLNGRSAGVEAKDIRVQGRRI